MQMGPASGAIAQSGASAMLKSTIAADLCEVLAPYNTRASVTLGAATWIVTADKTE